MTDPRVEALARELSCHEPQGESWKIEAPEARRLLAVIDKVDPTGTVTRVPNKRAEGQKMVTFWLSEEEFRAAKEAVDYLKQFDKNESISRECRKVVGNLVKRAERKKASDQ